MKMNSASSSSDTRGNARWLGIQALLIGIAKTISGMSDEEISIAASSLIGGEALKPDRIQRLRTGTLTPSASELEVLEQIFEIPLTPRSVADLIPPDLPSDSPLIAFYLAAAASEPLLNRTLRADEVPFGIDPFAVTLDVCAAWRDKLLSYLVRELKARPEKPIEGYQRQFLLLSGVTVNADPVEPAYRFLRLRVAPADAAQMEDLARPSPMVRLELASPAPLLPLRGERGSSREREGHPATVGS